MRNRVSKLNETLQKNTGHSFVEADFLADAEETFKSANRALQAFDDKSLFKLVTETAYFVSKIIFFVYNTFQMRSDYYCISRKQS